MRCGGTARACGGDASTAAEIRAFVRRGGNLVGHGTPTALEPRSVLREQFVILAWLLCRQCLQIWNAMADTSVDCDAVPPALKRRKVRKGTKSCWECKRRKIRCTFVAPAEPICDGCRSRRVQCISQEFYDEAKEASKTARLDRVEALVKQLAKRAGTDLPSLLSPNTQNAREKLTVSISSTLRIRFACIDLMTESFMSAAIHVMPLHFGMLLLMLDRLQA